MEHARLVLTIVAVVLLVLAAFPSSTAPRPWRLEWLAAALLVWAYLVI